jgi:hypothetical protein
MTVVFHAVAGTIPATFFHEAIEELSIEKWLHKRMFHGLRGSCRPGLQSFFPGRRQCFQVGCILAYPKTDRIAFFSTEGTR